MYYVYILKSSKDKKFYIGSTSDLKRRIKEHNRGKVKSTKFRQPLNLVYFEKYKDKYMACKREYFLKTPKGFLEKKKIINNITAGWSSGSSPGS